MVVHKTGFMYRSNGRDYKLYRITIARGNVQFETTQDMLFLIADEDMKNIKVSEMEESIKRYYNQSHIKVLSTTEIREVWSV